jgi:hypothetical protein
MTDLATQAPSSQPAGTPPLEDSLNAVLKSAPSLGESPGLAVGVAASGGDVAGRAQATARLANGVTDSAAKDVVNQSAGSGNAVSEALNWLGNTAAHAVSDVAEPVAHVGAEAFKDVSGLVNKPWNFVQHEFRYLQAVEQEHGLLASVGEGLALAGGAVAGTVAAGPWGGVLGAETAVGALGESGAYYKNLWSATSNPNYIDPRTHEPISIGGDFASLLGMRPGTRGYALTADGATLLSSFFLGGQEALGILSDIRSVGGASGLLANRFPGLGVATAEDVERGALKYGIARRAIQDIADHDSAYVIAHYPQLRNLAGPLGNANSFDGVVDVLKGAARSHELIYADKLPTLSITRVPFKNFREWAETLNSSEGKLARLVNPANWAQRFSRLPEATDILKGTISSEKFDPTDAKDAYGALFIRRQLLFAENAPTADAVVNEYIRAAEAGDLAAQKRIYENALTDGVLAMAHMKPAWLTTDAIVRGDFYDNLLRDGVINERDLSAWKETLDNALGGSDSHVGVYDFDENGNDISRGHDASGHWYSAGTLGTHTGKWSGIPLDEMRRWAQQVAGAKSVLGRLDDFAYYNITQPFFKRFVLLSLSYANHIALAEMIPNTIRLGFTNMVLSAAARTFAKMGWRAEDEELKVLPGLVWRALENSEFRDKIEQIVAGGHPEDLGPLTRRIEIAVQSMGQNGGNILPPMIDSGHNISSEVTRPERVTNALSKIQSPTHFRTLDAFEGIDRASWRHMESWQLALHEKAIDPAARIAADRFGAALRAGRSVDEAQADAAAAVSAFLHDPAARAGTDYEDLRWFARSKEDWTSFEGERPAGMDALDEWAHIIVRGVRGVTGSAARGFDQGLLQRIVDGEWVPEDQLKAVPLENRPIVVKGRAVAPMGDSRLGRLANGGFHRVLMPWVNYMSREPTYIAELDKQMSYFDKALEEGTINHDEAWTLAQSRAMTKTVRFVHNLHDRTQWTVTLRNWAPFYFAQEQAYRRFGRLLAESPLAFRRYQLTIANVHDIGQIMQGKNGGFYYVMPGTGWLTAPISEVMGRLGFGLQGASPVMMGWNLNSTNVIFPLSNGIRPDLGPVAAVPVEAINDFFPELGAPALKGAISSATNAALGATAAQESIWAQLIPNTILQRVITSIGGGTLDQRGFDSTMMQVMATLAYEHKIPPATADSTQMQAFIDRVRNYTRIMYAVKALVGGLAPVSPEVTVPTYDLFNNKVSAAIKKAGSINAGLTQFLHDNPDATPFTVFQSYAPSGAVIPESVAGEKWINSHLALIRKYPSAAFYLMPQNINDTYNASVYDEQLAQGFRVKYGPGQIGPEETLTGYLAQLYIAAGNSIVLDSWYPAYKKQIANLNGTPKYIAEQRFQARIARFALQNPIWGAWWNSDQKQTLRNHVVQELQQMFAAGDAPPGEQSDLVRQLLQNYNVYQAQYTQGANSGWTVESQTQIDQGWDDYLETVAKDFPQLRAFINGVFLTLPTAGQTNGT